MNITSISDGIVKITREDGNFLGISTGINKKAFHLTRITERKNSPGMLVHGNVIEEWQIEGFTEADGEIFLTGKYLECIPLPEVFRRGGRDGLSLLARLAGAIRLQRSRGLALPHIYANGILFSEDDSVLMLPLHAMDVIIKHHPIPYQIEYFESYNHPELKDDENLSFFLGVAAYRLLTGRLPFSAADESDLHDLMRSGSVLPPQFIRPELQPDVSDFILAALTGKDGRRPGLEDWAAVLEKWIAGGTERIITGEERSAILAAAGEASKKHTTSTARRAFFRNHGWKIVAGAAALVAVAWIAGSILSNVLKPRVTRGFAPEAVVRTFYENINTLDHMTMEDCVTGGAGKAFISEAMNYYVITRMRFSVEGTMGFVSADEWDKNGRPQPPAGLAVFGISGFEMSPDEASSPEGPVFDVSYEQWRPLPGDAQDAETAVVVRSTGVKVKERVSLKQDRGDWVIYRIERLSEEALGTVEALP